jgi:predicted protein tyrosine phosphatase
MTFPVVIVEPVEGAEELLLQDPDAALFRSVISISSHPVKLRPKCLPDNRRNVLYLTFDDIDHPEHGEKPPKTDDVLKILEFTKNNSASTSILVHCHAGISRSTATAVIMHMFWLGRGNEQQALDMVSRSIVDRMIHPNSLLIKLADDVMGCGGNLVKVVQEFNSKVDSHSHAGYGIWW